MRSPGLYGMNGIPPTHTHTQMGGLKLESKSLHISSVIQKLQAARVGDSRTVAA